jgi:hypothetical protein
VLALLVVVVLLATLFALRRLPRGGDQEVSAFHRTVGGLLLNLGILGALVEALAIGTGGDGPLLLLFFAPYLMLPPFLASIAAIVTGRHLRRGLSTSRIPSFLAGVLLALASGGWALLLADDGQADSVWFLRTDDRVDLTVAALGLFAISTAGVTAALVTRPRRGALRWQTGAVLVGSALVLTLVADAVSLSVLTPVELVPAGNGRGCDQVLHSATEPLGALDIGAVQPPLLPGLPVVGAYIAQPVFTGDRIDRDTLIIPGDTPLLVVAQLLEKGDGKRMLSLADQQIKASGLTPSGRGLASFNGDVTSADAGFTGSLDGSYRFLRCERLRLVVLTVGLHPEQLGACAKPPRAASCQALTASTKATVQVLQGALRAHDGPRPLVNLTARGNGVQLQLDVVASTPLAFLFDDVAEAMTQAGWKAEPFLCGPQLCPSFGLRTDLSRASWIRGSMRAVLTASPVGYDTRLRFVATG